LAKFVSLLFGFVPLRRNYTKQTKTFIFHKPETKFMATKKQSAKTSVAEQPAASAKATKTVKATATEKATKTVKAVAEKAPAVKATVKATETKAAPAAKTSKVTFTLPKEAVENAETVAVLGDFNNWQNGESLKKQKDGSFKASIELEKGRSYEYRFLIDGTKWENDWNAEAYKPTAFGEYNSVVTA
jgi:hypothetical protein